MLHCHLLLLALLRVVGRYGEKQLMVPLKGTQKLVDTSVLVGIRS